MAEEMIEAARENEQELAQELADAFINEVLPEDTFSTPKAGYGMWASQIRIMDPVKRSLKSHSSRMKQSCRCAW